MIDKKLFDNVYKGEEAKYKEEEESSREVKSYSRERNDIKHTQD
ncbi:unnamed protein product [Arabidopsis halleri]